MIIKQGIILQVKNLTKTYTKNDSIFTAVDNVSFSLYKKECLGLVGESGCGKSTIAKLITKLQKADSGEIILDKVDITKADKKQIKSVYKKIQMVFQLPQDSFNPREKLYNSIIEPLLNNGMKKQEAMHKLEQLLPLVELNYDIVNAYPHQVSGGQCQRAAIARAIAINPQILICDEATSALDATIQKQIILLLKNLQQKLNLSILLICHDLALVQKLCDRILIMHNGKIVEYGLTKDIIKNPKNEYTKLLIESAY